MRTADLFDAERDEDPDHAEVVFDGKFGELGALVAGPTVEAPVVAAVGDGDAEIGDEATELIVQP